MRRAQIVVLTVGLLPGILLPAGPLPAEEPFVIVEETEERRGVFFAGYGFPRDSFEFAFEQIMRYLIHNGVMVVNKPQEAGPYRMNLSSLNYFRENIDVLEADSLLFLRVETPERQADVVSLLCFDRKGALMWQEEVLGTIELTYPRSAEKMLRRLKKKLKNHLVDSDLPIDYRLKSSS